jgi:hypothetical protein
MGRPIVANPNYPLAIISWHDAWVDESPVDASTVGFDHSPKLIHTIGWVLKSDAVGITVVNEFYDDTYRGRTFIPAAMIVSVQEFTLSKKRARHVASNNPIDASRGAGIED